MLPLLSKALALDPANDGFLFVRAIVHFALSNFKDSYEDINSAMDHADKDVPVYFYVRALIFLTLRRFESAMNDLNVGLTLKDCGRLLPEMHLTLAKCHACLGDKGDALLCLQRYANSTSLTRTAHEFAGNLLLSIGAFKDAARAFSYLPDLRAKPHLLERRIYCNLAVKELSLVIKDLKVLAFTHNDRGCRADLLCLEALKLFSEPAQPQAKQELLALGAFGSC